MGHSEGEISLTPTVKKSKSKKQRDHDQDAAPHKVNDTEAIETEKPSNKRKRIVEDTGVHENPEGNGENVLSNGDGEREKKPKKEKKKSVLAAESQTPKRKSKKRGKEVENSASGDDIQEPKKKKRKNKTGFQDPEEDTTLSDQARKALAYAFMQFRHPSKWKFNKARQNWIIRNFWSNETLPDAYLPLATRYLAGVQGGVRENLIKTGKSILEPPVPVPVPVPVTDEVETPSAPADPNPTPIPPVDEVKLARARVLLEAVSSVEGTESTQVI